MRWKNWSPIVILFSLLVPSCKQQSQVISDQCPLQVLTPATSNQKIAKIICNNGLPLVIISNPNLPVAGASILVKTGNSSDPTEYPGMAHFTEHCVFLGNKKYPKVSGFPKFLSNHNGTYNAFTSSSRTTYIFSVERSAFSEAVDQFVHLFIQPLFRQEDLDREKYAVDQEFAAHPLSDERRVQRIQQLMSPKEHPLARFGCGNATTLTPVTTKNMSEWFYLHYSPENMCAIAYTPDPLPQAIRQLSKVFSRIPKSKCYQAHNPWISPHNTSSLKNIYINQAVQPVSSLEIYWHFYNTPLKISLGCYEALAHILKYEGEHSLVSLLKKEELITKLDVEFHKSSSDTAELYIYYELTEKGDQDYSEVIFRTFQYFHYIQTKGIPDYCLEELSKMNALDYCYSSKSQLFDLLKKQISILADEDLATYPYYSLVYPKYSIEEEAHLLSIVSDPEQAHFVLSTKNPLHWERTREHYDAIFDMTYYDKPLANFEQCKQAIPESTMALPQPNLFIPKDIVLPKVPIGEKSKFPFMPILSYENDKLTVYHCEDVYYTAPKFSSQVRIRSPQISREELSSLVVAELYCLAINEKLLENYYPATMAGLSFSLALGGEGIDLKVCGYTATGPTLLKSILSLLPQFSVTQSHFNIYKKQLLEHYKQMSTACPVRAGLDELLSCVVQGVYSHMQKLSVLEELSFSQFQSLTSTLFDNVHIEAMSLGNFSDDEKKNYITALQDFVISRSAYITQPFYYKLNPSKVSSIDYDYPLTANGMLLLLQDECSPSLEGRVAAEMLFNWLHHITFEQLRTQEQLGYMVGARYRELALRPFGFLYIRSDTYSPEELLSKTQVFLKDVANAPEKFGMSEKYFEGMRKAYISKIREPEHSLDAMNSILFSLAFEYPSTQLNSPNEKIAAAETLTYEDFVKYCCAFLTEKLGQETPVCIRGCPSI
ncbi:insulinase family protein [Candidatus Chlamydia sanziniae]|uniref:Protease 3 n=1 Tax=Candidatus Chlamydia sanziniae TaxID=1806891 RepID=A0A1A9HWE8_9CHLA|nr:insulinase family protein [Candidatus Chlamydia sanziniae]ANH78751.1 Protease III precursor [Candidatus Chlamydia sanziniae]